MYLIFSYFLNILNKISDKKVVVEKVKCQIFTDGGSIRQKSWQCILHIMLLMVTKKIFKITFELNNKSLP
jgi:hypothetical protein